MRHPFRRLVPVIFLLAAGLAGPGGDLQHTAAPEAPIAAPPTPPPTPAPPVVVYGCGLPRGTGDGRRCGFENTVFYGQVRFAIEKTMREHPEWFEGEHALEV